MIPNRRGAVAGTCVAAIALAACVAAPRVAASSTAGSPYDRRVTAVEIQPRWLAAGTTLPLKPGDALTPANLSAALNAVKDSVSARGEQYGRALGAPLVTVTYVEPAFALGDHNDVAVTLRPFYLALPVTSMGKLALSVPRELPRGERRLGLHLQPVELGLSSDRAIGTAADAALRLGFGAKPGRTDPFSFRVSGQHSLENANHAVDAALRASLQRESGRLRTAYLAAEAYTARQPKGESWAKAEAAGARFGIGLAPLRRSRLFFDGAYHRVEERFDQRIWSGIEDTPDEFATRVLFERIPRSLGFVRAAIWHEVQRSPAASTQRLVGRIGYAREWLLQPNQGIGVELVAGGGQMWGVSPERRRFYGGTAAGNFLHAAADSAVLLHAPEGPMVRSFGRAQAAFVGPAGATRGGTRFRHVNVNVSLPVPRWSRPLIPDESVGIPGPQGRELTLKDMLRNQVDRSGPNMLAASLAEIDRLDPPEAQRRAADVFSDIQPAAHYIIDRANVFAIKPLLLFDAARLETDTQSASWTAAGAGLQLIVVTARVEAGYMRTLSGPTRSDYNIFVQLGFERLF